MDLRTKSDYFSIQLQVIGFYNEEKVFFFSIGATDLIGPGPPHYRSFTMTLR
jgi:hypothetical protein